VRINDCKLYQGTNLPHFRDERHSPTELPLDHYEPRVTRLRAVGPPRSVSATGRTTGGEREAKTRLCSALRFVAVCVAEWAIMHGIVLALRLRSVEFGGMSLYLQRKVHPRIHYACVVTSWYYSCAYALLFSLDGLRGIG
jgi:hypothetical protein